MRILKMLIAGNMISIFITIILIIVEICHTSYGLAALSGVGRFVLYLCMLIFESVIMMVLVVMLLKYKKHSSK